MHFSFSKISGNEHQQPSTTNEKKKNPQLQLDNVTTELLANNRFSLYLILFELYTIILMNIFQNLAQKVSYFNISQVFSEQLRFVYRLINKMLCHFLLSDLIFIKN